LLARYWWFLKLLILLGVCSKTNITDYEETTKAVHTSPVKESDDVKDEEEDDEEEEGEESAENDEVEPSEFKQEL